jgi:hypothetical protein
MACGSEDRTVSIWDVYNKNNKRETNS